MAGDTSVRERARVGLRLREILTVTEERPAADQEASSLGGLRVAVAAVVPNPLAGRDEEDLAQLVDLGEQLGSFLAERVLYLVDEAAIEAVGQAAIVGRDGELEHAAALIGPGFAAAVRSAVVDWRPTTPSVKKLGGPGTALAVPLSPRRGLAVPDPAVVEVRVPGHPTDDEAVVVLAVAASSRGG